MSTAIAKNFQVGTSGTPADNFTIFQPATPDGTLRIGNGNTGITTGLVTLNSAGNLGLGVTPSAWLSNRRAIEVGGQAAAVLALNGTAAVSEVFANAIRNTSGTYIYAQTGPASYVNFNNQSGGGWAWSIAPSGTAGNAISFTQAMTLDASGNLSLGSTSNASRLDITGPDNIGGTLASRVYSANRTAFLGFGFNTISANSNASGLFLEALGANPMAFSTNGSERARIGTSGEQFGVSTGGYGIKQGLTAGAGTTFAVYVGCHTATSGNPSSGTDSFIVWSNGNVVNTNNSYGPISDVKLKENIVDATPKLEKLLQVRIVNYNLKADLGYESHKQIGVIAQELEQVFPGLVDESPDIDKEGNDLGTTTKSVKMSVFVPMLIKAIQEQQAIIQTLTARIESLESK